MGHFVLLKLLDILVSLDLSAICLLPFVSGLYGIKEPLEKPLNLLNVKIIHNTRVMPRTDLANGEVSVNLSDGGLGTFDAYIDATSGAPNTKFLPATRLNDTKHVAADVSTLCVTKSPPRVYSIGDVAFFCKVSAMDATCPVPVLGYSIWSDLHESNGGKGGSARTAILKKESISKSERMYNSVPLAQRVVLVLPLVGRLQALSSGCRNRGPSRWTRLPNWLLAKFF
jgi:hypothetical protein